MVVDFGSGNRVVVVVIFVIVAAVVTTATTVGCRTLESSGKKN
jgi:hypothetical protein